jgi:PPP family 3-phenylpropionic acid transporter
MNSRHKKFSLFYFLSISIYAFILAFFPLHCKVIGLSAFEIAVVTAFGTLATVVGPPLAIYLAHNFFASRKILLVSSTLSVLAYLPLIYSNSLYLISAAWFCINCFKRASDAIVDTKALNVEGNFSFERVRMWGSIGFMITMAIMGPLVDFYGAKTIVPFGMFLSLLVFCASFNIKNEIENLRGKDKVKEAGTNTVFPKALIPFFMLLIVAFSLITASHSAAYIYLSIYLNALSWSASEISWAWNIGVFSEVIVFVYFSKLEKRFGLIGSFWISAIFTALRWFILATYQDKSIILLSQVLHGFSFAGCYTAAVKLIAKAFPPAWRDRGQGIIISVGFGVGAVVGRLIMGKAAEKLASDLDLNILFLISSYIAMVSVVLIGLLHRENSRTSILEKKFA